MTPAQKRAMSDLWPQWGIEYSPALLDVESIFNNTHPLIIEIGFGNGELLTTMAAENPDKNFIGIEVHEPGVGHCLLKVEEKALTNVRVICHDAIEVLEQQIPNAALHGVHLFFPDPWHKKRHFKRRIVQTTFMDLLSGKIIPGGYFYPATDWANYAEHIDEVVSAHPGFRALQTDTSKRPETKFELRGKRLGHEIWECIYERR